MLQAKALLTGIALAGGLLLASSSKGATKKGSGASSAGNTTPSGADPADLADSTTKNLISQDIAGLRTSVQAWTDAGDPLTAGALQFTLDAAVSGQQLVEWTNDGSSGSPLLRAFGDRVLLLEGRPEKLNLWADAWASTLPLLAAGLRAKAQGIDPSAHTGTTDDAAPPPGLLQQIGDALASGSPATMRALADKLDAAGFPEQASDLRAAADMLEKGTAKAPDPGVPPAPTPTPAGAPPKPAVPAKPSTSLLQLGSRGAAVSAVQQKLGIKVDGIFGPDTKAAVIAFQKAHGLNADGIVGPQTQAALAAAPAQHALGLPDTSATAPKPASKPASSATGSLLQLGSRGPAVAAVQQKVGVTADGVFGAQTKAAVIAFQKAHGITADGIVGPQTQAALASAPVVTPEITITAKPPTGSGTTLASAPVPAAVTLRIGSSGSSVVLLQQKLGVPADGKYGPQTQAAVIAFQKAHGLSADGIAGPLTLAALNGSVAGDTYRHLMYGGKNQLGTLPHLRNEFGADAPLDGRQTSAGKIALMAHYGKLDPDLLAEWQKREGIKQDPPGKYGPQSAYVLCFRYGIVPPVPHFMPPGGIKQFVGQMAAAARKDGVRRDEYKATADKAVALASKKAS